LILQEQADLKKRVGEAEAKADELQAIGSQIEDSLDRMNGATNMVNEAMADIRSAKDEAEQAKKEADAALQRAEALEQTMATFGEEVKDELRQASEVTAKAAGSLTEFEEKIKQEATATEQRIIGLIEAANRILRNVRDLEDQQRQALEKARTAADEEVVNEANRRAEVLAAEIVKLRAEVQAVNQSANEALDLGRKQADVARTALQEARDATKVANEAVDVVAKKEAAAKAKEDTEEGKEAEAVKTEAKAKEAEGELEDTTSKAKKRQRGLIDRVSDALEEFAEGIVGQLEKEGKKEEETPPPPPPDPDLEGLPLVGEPAAEAAPPVEAERKRPREEPPEDEEEEGRPKRQRRQPDRLVPGTGDFEEGDIDMRFGGGVRKPDQEISLMGTGADTGVTTAMENRENMEGAGLLDSAYRTPDEVGLPYVTTSDGIEDEIRALVFDRAAHLRESGYNMQEDIPPEFSRTQAFKNFRRNVTEDPLEQRKGGIAQVTRRGSSLSQPRVDARNVSGLPLTRYMPYTTELDPKDPTKHVYRRMYDPFYVRPDRVESGSYKRYAQQKEVQRKQEEEAKREAVRMRYPENQGINVMEAPPAPETIPAPTATEGEAPQEGQEMETEGAEATPVQQPGIQADQGEMQVGQDQSVQERQEEEAGEQARARGLEEVVDMMQEGVDPVGLARQAAGAVGGFIRNFMGAPGAEQAPVPAQEEPELVYATTGGIASRRRVAGRGPTRIMGGGVATHHHMHA